MISARQHAVAISSLEQVILDPTMREKIPYFFDYFKGYVATKRGIVSYFLQSAVIAEHCQIQNRNVLDIGCGLGLRAICLALLGARKVVGIDIAPEMVDGFAALLKEFPNLNIEVQKGDFLVNEYAPSSQDVVVLADAISHIRDTQLLLNKIEHVLSPGGHLYLLDGNNDMFLPGRIWRRKFWERCEHGPSAQGGDFHGRAVERLCFHDARMEIIKSHQPFLDYQTLKTIARRTQGMYGQEIVEAAAEYLNKGTISAKPSFPYRNPYTGEYPELGFNPFSLVKQLRKRRFDANIVTPPLVQVGITVGLSRPKSVVADLVCHLLKRFPRTLVPFFCPSFAILATKASNDAASLKTSPSKCKT